MADEFIEELRKLGARRQERSRRFAEGQARDREEAVALLLRGRDRGLSMGAMARALRVTRKTAYDWLGLQDEPGT